MSVLSMVLSALSVGLLVAYVLDVPLAECSDRGAQGFARQKARKSALFRLFEPLLRLLATHISELPLDKQRKKMGASILAAGEFHGLGANEVLALSGLSGIACAAVGYYFWSASGGVVVPVVCCVLGPLLPAMQLSSLAKARHKSVNHGLPAAIDLAALCMGAGLDFPGAISHVVENMPDKGSPVR